MTLREVLSPIGNTPAILGSGRNPLSHRDLHDQIELTRLFLRRNGFTRDACIAIVLPPGPDLASAFLCFASACRTTPLSASLKSADYAFVFRDTASAAILVSDGTPQAALDAARDCGLRVLRLRPEPRAGAWTLICDSPQAPVDDDLPTPQDTALFLHTSGTTSRPKLVPIRHSAFVSSARSVAASLDLTSDDRCLSVMPLFHIHGLSAGLAAPLIAGGSVWCAPGFQAHRFFAWLGEADPTWYTAVPTMHQAVLLRARHQEHGLRAHRLRFVRTCSAPMPLKVWAELESAFGVPVVSAYGMTEAAHQISCTSLVSGAGAFGSVGTSSGPEIAIVDPDGHAVPRGDKGEVVLRGPQMLTGYASPPEANATAFFGDWFRTGDEGLIDEEGNLRLTGRLKELINSGGEKISPYDVEEAILRHDAVQEAVVFAAPHELLGESVAAAVVIRDGAALTAASLREWLRAELAAHKIPRRVEIVPEIPRGGTGKLQRIGMASRLGLVAVAD